MFDATLLAIGAEQPRDLLVSGRGYDNVFFAMEYLSQQNRLVAGEIEASGELIDANGRVVVVIGGGDTGSDCVGTAIRQGAREVHQFEILPEPPAGRNPKTPWPQWPNILRTTSSHEEGCRRRWSVLVQQLSGSRAGVQVSQLHGCDVEWVQTARGMQMIEKPGTDFVMDVDLVLIAMGFAHVAHLGLVDALDLALDDRNNIRVDANHMTSVRGVFAAGDSTRGASLVVRAIEAGRRAASGIDGWLRESS
jgi:glutamate synthase (NADPH/NADH) small chain